MAASKMKNKCICQICTCGRHRCPHNRGSLKSIPDTSGDCKLASEYQEKFEGMDYQKPREAIRPTKKEPSSPVPMDMTTMYTETFVTHEIMPRKIRSKEQFVPSTTPMNKRTTYKMDYTAKEGKRTKSYAPEYQYVERRTKFNSSTIHNTAFKGFNEEDMKICRPRTIRHKENLTAPEEKFKCASTVQDDYKEHTNLERTKPIIPKQEGFQDHNEKFDDRTMYKDTYGTEKPLSEPPKRIKKKESTLKPATFFSETTVMADYKPHVNPKRAKCYKPKVKPISTKVPFDDRTTCSMAYKEWEVKKHVKPIWANKKAYDRPNIIFTKLSSYQEDFQTPKDFEKALCKPIKNELEMDHSKKKAPFCMTTHYQDMFTELDGKRPDSFKVVNIYKPPKEKFQVESHQQSQYKGAYIEPAIICRPPSQSEKVSRGKMIFDTTYRKCYTGENSVSCPVYGLPLEETNQLGSPVLKTNTKDSRQGDKNPDGKSDFIFTMTRHGHKFFSDVKSPQKNAI
ncbi:unnamed protein product [Owenia fusiformis]|uniref:Uncharacterized protein n=1 Tax=Owenia fusiformis TaxID=6347 RepID=A0A8J1T484_OWEFU|nr:unnamed protein product [Owenia fusiformis]